VALVALVATLATLFLTARITSSLKRLAQASAAVAGGDLERSVVARGPEEIESLAGSFNAMTASLRRTMEELSRRSALAAVGEFAASLAHEVRNGLTSVKVDLQRAEERLEPESASGALVSRSLFAVTRLNSTVTGALQVARSGRVDAQEVDLRAVLSLAVQRARGTFQMNDASVDVDELCADPLMVKGDPDALEQLFVNVLLNAGQALDVGARAHVRTSVENGRVEVLIADTGPGIAPEHLLRVLDPFFTTRAGGTGLGLPIARQIAVAHGGSLSVESAVGVGTTVRVALPHHTRPPKQAATAGPQALIDGPSRRA
jgi:signal transduction histidine kinase